MNKLNYKLEINNYFITGANSPLGKAIVDRLIKNPSNRLLLTSYKKSEDLKNLIDGTRVGYISGINLLNKKDLILLKQKVTNFFKSNFNVINCTGYYLGQEPFEKTSIDEAKKIFDGNFLTVYNTAYTLLPLMKLRGGGHFILFGCNSVVYNYPWMAAFTAAKTALQSLATSLAHEYAEDNIHINTLRLATLQTPRELTTKPYGDQKNWINPYDIAELIESLTQGPFSLINGAAIDLYKPSPLYYHQSYFDRIKR